MYQDASHESRHKGNSDGRDDDEQKQGECFRLLKCEAECGRQKEIPAGHHREDYSDYARPKSADKRSDDDGDEIGGEGDGTRAAVYFAASAPALATWPS